MIVDDAEREDLARGQECAQSKRMAMAIAVKPGNGLSVLELDVASAGPHQPLVPVLSEPRPVSDSDGGVENRGNGLRRGRSRRRECYDHELEVDSFPDRPDYTDSERFLALTIAEPQGELIRNNYSK